MYNSDLVTSALYNQIKSYSDVLKNNYIVEHSDYINNDPDRTPWVGVYKGPIRFDPRTLGRHNQSWTGALEIYVFIQAANAESSKTCSSLLGEIEYNTLNAIWSDPTLDGNIQIINGLEIEYNYKNENMETLYYQQAMITIMAELQTG